MRRLIAVCSLASTLALITGSVAHAQDCSEEIATAQQMVDAFPDDSQAYETLGEAQVCAAQCVEAWATLSKAVEMGSPRSVLRAAETCMKRLVVNSICSEATSEARKLVELAPRDPLAHTILAQALTCESGCAERLVALSEAVSLGADPSLLENPDLSCIDQMVRDGKCNEAIDEAQMAQKVLPRAPEIYISLAEAQACKGDCVAAWESVAAAGERGADVAANRSAQSCMLRLIKGGDCDASQAQASEIVRRFPKEIYAQMLYGDAMACSGGCADGYVAWNKAVALGGPEDLSPERTGACLKKLLDSDECDLALEQATAVSRLNTRDPAPVWSMAEARFCKEDFAGALADYERFEALGGDAEQAAQAIGLSRAQLSSLSTRAVSEVANMIAQGQCTEAVVRASAVRETLPESPEVVLSLAEAQACAGQCTGASKSVAAAASLGADVSENQSVKKCLTHLVKSGDCAQAQKEARALLKSSPRDRVLQGALGAAQSCQSDCVGAWKSYGMAVDDPSEVFRMRSACFSRLVQSDQCELALDQASSLSRSNSKDSAPVWQMAEARYCMEDYRGSVADYQRFQELGGDADQADQRVKRSRQHLASLVIKIVTDVEGVKLPRPQIEGIPAELIQFKGDGVYMVQDTAPAKVRIKLDAGEGYWPVDRAINLQGGQFESVELALMPAVFTDLKIGHFSPELQLKIQDSRSGDYVNLEPGQVIQLPAGSSEIRATFPTGALGLTAEIPVTLEQGAQDLALPWGWRVTEVSTGELLDAGLVAEESASVEFSTRLPLPVRPVPEASYSSSLQASPGQIQDFSVDLTAHPSVGALEALERHEGSGRRDRVIHWGLLGSAVVLEGVALAQLSAASSHAETARGITDARLSAEYETAVKLSRRGQVVGLGLAVGGGAAIGSGLLVTRPRVKGRSEIRDRLKVELEQSIELPLAVESSSAKVFHDREANAYVARASEELEADLELSDPAYADEAFSDARDSTRARVSGGSGKDLPLSFGLGMALAPLVTLDSEEMGLEWDFESSRMPRALLRVSWNLNPRISLTGSWLATPKYSIINDSSDTYWEALYLVGMDVEVFEREALKLIPHASVGILHRRIAPDGVYDLHDMSPALELGLRTQFALGTTPLSLYVDLSRVQKASDIQQLEQIYVTSSGGQGALGLRVEL